MKFINVNLLSDGKHMMKNIPVIYSGENKSTTLRLYFEDSKYKDEVYKKYITLSNKIIGQTKTEDYTYEMSNSEFLLRHEHLSVGELYITLEVTKELEVGMPIFKIKWVLDKLIILPAKDIVPTVDWKKEYEELFKEGYKSTLTSLRENITSINLALGELEINKANVINTYDKDTVDLKIQALNDDLKVLNDILNTFQLDFNSLDNSVNTNINVINMDLNILNSNINSLNENKANKTEVYKKLDTYSSLEIDDKITRVNNSIATLEQLIAKIKPITIRTWL